LRTLINLQHVETGFNTRNLLLFSVDPNLIGYKGDKLAQLYQQMNEHLDSVPGVRFVTFSRTPLLSESESDRSLYLPGESANNKEKENRQVYIHQVRENFLEAMEIPLLLGRSFTTQDDGRAPKVAVVN